MVKVRIKPLHNIGGVGKAGDVVTMSEADAEMYFRDGYVEYVDAPPPTPPQIQNANLEKGDEPVEDHKIMKPRSKRKK